MASKKLTDKQLQEVRDLIDNEKWEEAENILLNLQKRDGGDGRAYYLFGCIFDEWNNPNKSKEKATKYFGLATESGNPTQDAFIRLARLETNQSHSKRILKKGLQIFPNSESIYYQFLNYIEDSDREPIFREANAKGCISERMKISMAETYFRLSKFEECLDMLSSIQVDDENDNNVLRCIEGFALYERGNTKKAYKIFQGLADQDISHKLEYVPIFGLILILSEQGKISEAEQIAEELPLNVPVDIFLGAPWGGVYFDAESYRLTAINSLLKKTKSKEIKGRLRGIKGLFTYSDVFEAENTTKSSQQAVIKDFEFAHKMFPAETEYLQYLFWIFKEEGRDPLKAWNYLHQFITNSKSDIHTDYDDFIKSLEPQVFQTILKDFWPYPD